VSRRRQPGGSGSGDSIEEQVRAVIADTFDLDEDELPTPPSRETIPGWTSRSQMTLFLNLEDRFDVRFSLDQMVRMTSAQRISEELGVMLDA
jgi:acyl carrier protein